MIFRIYKIKFKPVKGLEPSSVTYEATALTFELHRQQINEMPKPILR